METDNQKQHHSIPEPESDGSVDFESPCGSSSPSNDSLMASSNDSQHSVENVMEVQGHDGMSSAKRGVKRQGSDEHHDDGEDPVKFANQLQILMRFTRIESSILSQAQGWLNMGIADKVHLLGKPSSRTLFKLDNGDFEFLQRILNQWREAEMRLEAETKHCLLETFFLIVKTVMENNAIKWGLNSVPLKEEADFVESTHAFLPPQKINVPVWENLHKIEGYLSIVQDMLKADRSPKTDVFLASKSKLVVLSDRVQERIGNAIQIFEEIFGNVTNDKNIRKQEMELDTFGSKLLNLSKFRNLRLLFTHSTSRSPSDHHFQATSVGFNSNSSLFGTILGKWVTVFDWNEAAGLQGNLGRSEGTQLYGVRNVSTAFVWHPLHPNQMCVAGFCRGSNSAGLSVVDINRNDVAQRKFVSNARSEYRAVDWECDGNKIASIALNHCVVEFWSPSSLEPLGTMNVKSCIPTCIRFSPYRKDFLALGYADGSVTLHDNRNLGKPWSDIPPSSSIGLCGPVTGLEFVSGNKLLVANYDGPHRLFKIDGTMPARQTFTYGGRDLNYPCINTVNIACQNDFVVALDMKNELSVFSSFSENAVVRYNLLNDGGVGSRLPRTRAEAGSLAWCRWPESNTFLANFQDVLCCFQLEF